MSLGKAVKSAAGFINQYFSEIVGTLIVFAAGIAAKEYFGTYNFYTVLIQSFSCLLILAYLENVKYGWVDND